MRTRHAATALAVVAAGLTAAAALRHRLGAPVDTTTATGTPAAAVAVVPEHVAVVLPFARPVPAGPVREQPGSPARCGDNGGRTKAGAPCGSRATSGGRCRHHPIAA